MAHNLGSATSFLTLNFEQPWPQWSYNKGGKEGNFGKSNISATCNFKLTMMH